MPRDRPTGLYDCGALQRLVAEHADPWAFSLLLDMKLYTTDARRRAVRDHLMRDIAGKLRADDITMSDYRLAHIILAAWGSQLLAGPEFEGMTADDLAFVQEQGLRLRCFGRPVNFRRVREVIGRGTSSRGKPPGKTR